LSCDVGLFEKGTDKLINETTVDFFGTKPANPASNCRTIEVNVTENDHINFAVIANVSSTINFMLIRSENGETLIRGSNEQEETSVIAKFDSDVKGTVVGFYGIASGD